MTTQPSKPKATRARAKASDTGPAGGSNGSSKATKSTKAMQGSAGPTSGSSTAVLPAAITAVGPGRSSSAGEATTIDVRQGGIGRATATDIAVSSGGIGIAQGQRVSLEMGGVGVALGGEVRVTQSMASYVLARRDVTVDQSLVSTLIGDHVTIRRPSAVLVLIARQVDGSVRPLLDWRGALAAGAVAGIVMGLFRIGRR